MGWTRYDRKSIAVTKSPDKPRLDRSPGAVGGFHRGRPEARRADRAKRNRSNGVLHRSPRHNRFRSSERASKARPR